MKKRKKRRSKTEGGDKLPFDAEMGKNQKAIKVLQRLFDAGYGTEKEIVNMMLSGKLNAAFSVRLKQALQSI